jgi:uncharacterized protein (DUF2236 family)
MTDPPAHPPCGGTSGLYGPESISWRINREAVLLLGGPRALLLQLAHPLVAAGVAEHSDFLADPLRRLRRTLTAMLSIVFGDAAVVTRCAAGVAEAHARVRGSLGEGTRSFPAGTVYDARDPRLLLWVHATLVDSGLTTYEWSVAALTERDRARFYEESKAVARLLGVPDHALPDTYPDFLQYVEEMLAGPLAEITPTARRLARAVLRPRVAGPAVPALSALRAFRVFSALPPCPAVPLLPPGGSAAIELVTAGLLPPAVRASYGLRWNERRAAAHRALGRLVQATLPWLPDVLRAMPQAREAARRSQVGAGRAS